MASIYNLPLNDLFGVIEQELSIQDVTTFSLTCREFYKERNPKNVNRIDKLAVVLNDTYFSLNLGTWEKMMIEFYNENGTFIACLKKTKCFCFCNTTNSLVSRSFDVWEDEGKQKFLSLLREKGVESYKVISFNLKNEVRRLRRRLQGVLLWKGE